MELSKQEMELFSPFPVIGSKIFFDKSIPIWYNKSKIVFRNRKWNHLNSKWNYLSHFQPSYQKTSLTKVSPFGPMIPKWFSETETELSKQEMELFLPFPVIRSKNLFKKNIPVWSNDSKMVFRNRKRIYLNRKWNYFSPF
jgi:hypothetical protein